MIKGKVKGIYLRRRNLLVWKAAKWRRSIVSLETRDYAKAVQRAREIMERPELQLAQAFMPEVERFLKYKYETNRLGRTSRNSVGPGLDPESQFGPLVSEEQYGGSPATSTRGYRRAPRRSRELRRRRGSRCEASADH